MTDFQIDLPDAHVAGTPAHGLNASHPRPGQVVLDFVVRDDRRVEPTLLVVQRIMLDPTAMQSVLRALSQELDDYERDYGPVTSPE